MVAQQMHRASTADPETQEKPPLLDVGPRFPHAAPSSQLLTMRRDAFADEAASARMYGSYLAPAKRVS